MKKILYSANIAQLITLVWFGLVGITCRIIFIPFTFHNDIFFIHVFASKLAYNGIFDIYAYIKTNFANTLFKEGYNYYPPLAYFLLGIFHSFLKFFNLNFGVWINRFSEMMASGNYSSYLDIFKVPLSELCTYLFIMKTPYLIFDLSCILIFFAYFKNINLRLRVFKFWMINPVVIFGSYIFGHFDIILTCFLLFSLFLISKKRFYGTMIVLGLSVLLKSTPLILIFPVGFILGRNIKHSICLILAALAPIFITLVPFYLLNGNYMISSFFPLFLGGPGANYLDTVEFSIGKFIFVIGYFLIFYVILRKKQKCDPAEIISDSWKYYLSFILLTYFIKFAPVHHFQWVIPFLIIGIVKNKISAKVYFFQIICLFIYAINSRPLSGQLFLPLNPDFFYNLKGLPEFMNQYVKWGVVMRLARWGFHLCSLYIIGKIIFKPEVKSA